MSEGAEHREREHGDRAEFLASARRRLATPAPVNHVHPPSPVPATVPVLTYDNVDATDLIGSFDLALTRVSGVCHRTAEPTVPSDVLAAIVDALPTNTAVVSDEPEAARVGLALSGLGVEVQPYDRHAGARAALGVTSAIAAIAATGSVVVDSRRAGGRGASLLPAVNLCVLPADRLVATPGEIFRSLTGHPEVLPSNLVLISGPSRTGDIEQLITLGVHGPVAVHVVLTSCTVATGDGRVDATDGSVRTGS